MKKPDQQAGCGYPQTAFFILGLLAIGLLSGCAGKGSKPEMLDSASCQQEITSIARVQGSGKQSPLNGITQTLRGIVTQLTAGEGLYIQQPMADLDPLTSDGIYIDAASLLKQAALGDLLVVTGTVAELGKSERSDNSLTSLTQISAYTICAKQQPLPVSAVKLPLSAIERESLESMRLEVNQDLTVTEVYQLHKRHQLSLAAGDQLITPTETTAPGPGIKNLERANRNRLLVVQLPATTTVPNTQIGDQASNLTGVMTQLHGRYQLLSEDSLDLSPRFPPVLPVKSGQLRLMSFNLYNYFNGDGQQAGFPTSRGAQTYPEFIKQTQQLTSTIKHSEADLVAFQEMENDGYGDSSALADLKRALNQSMPEALWEFATPSTERNGAGPISVGILYRSSRLQALGPAISTSDQAFKQLSRQPLAQLFKDKQSGNQLLVVSNHFKSKGSCPEDQSDINANQNDGQACWNAARVEASEALSAWLNNLRNITANANMIILGDLNSYRMEDPIQKLISRGWVELVEQDTVAPQFSFVYFGQAGTLDYAFATPELAEKVSRALIWNINSPIAPGSALNEPSYFGSSDHDPVIVDLDFSVH